MTTHTEPTSEAVEVAFDRTACSYAIGRKGGLDETYIITYADFRLIRAALTAAREQVSELQSATANDATRIIAYHVPWRHNGSHPRRVVLAYIKQLQERARKSEAGMLLLAGWCAQKGATGAVYPSDGEHYTNAVNAILTRARDAVEEGR